MTREELMALDREFCRQVAVGGSKAWASFFADSGIMVSGQGENIVGPDAIRLAMETFLDTKGNSLIWQPSDGLMSDDESLGYTHGTYIRRTLDEAAKVLESRGKYTSIWQRQEKGHYKVTLDIGN